MSFSLRPAAPEDADAVAHMHVRSWRAGYRGLLPDPYLDGLRPQDRAARYSFGDDGPDRAFTVVAVEGKEIVGFATVSACRDAGTSGAVGEVDALYVDPSRWGAGAGRLLVADARARLARHGFDEAVLWVLAGNERAERFYRRDGWVADGSRRQDDVWGVTVDLVRWRRALPGDRPLPGSTA